MPCVLDPMGYQWNIGMGQERPVCLTLGALGRGPDYVDAGARCPQKRGILEREREPPRTTFLPIKQGSECG